MCSSLKCSSLACSLQYYLKPPSLLVVFGLTSIFLVTICCCNLNVSSNCRLNININTVIEKFFKMWGKLVASHPVIVILLTLGAALGISAGALKLQITTDPVELWAAPTSRSRIEKDFFDKTFRPFYRTEQIIITAKNLSSVSFSIQSQLRLYFLGRTFMCFFFHF